MTEISYILIKVVRWVYTVVQTHQTLKWVHFVAHTLHLNKLTEAISLGNLEASSRAYGQPASCIILSI